MGHGKVNDEAGHAPQHGLWNKRRNTLRNMRRDMRRNIRRNMSLRRNCGKWVKSSLKANAAAC